MSQDRVTEAMIDEVIARNLTINPAFAARFVRLVTGREISAISNVKKQAAHVGSSGTIDIDARFGADCRLLIENKINARYSVTADGDQPSRYARTAQSYRSYGVDCRTVLVAPSVYLRARGDQCGFDGTVTYEAMTAWLEGDALALVSAAIEQAETPYIGEMVEANTQFFAAYEALAADEFPSLILKKSPNADGGRPATSRSIYFDVRRTLAAHPAVPRPMMSIQCWEQAQPTPSVKIMIGRWASLCDRLSVPDSLSAIGGYLRPAAQSLAIAINTPLMEVEKPFADQVEQVREGLNAAARLQHWWNTNRTVIQDWATAAGANGPTNLAAIKPLRQINGTSSDWHVSQIIDTATQRNPRYLDVIDDIVSGEIKATELEARYGSHDVVISALAYVTRTVHGIGSGTVPRLEDGGWYARLGDFHQVHPAFRHAWQAARG